MEDNIIIFFGVLYALVCAGFLHWADNEEKIHPPAKCREPFPSWVPNALAKKTGDALASKRDWWCWQLVATVLGFAALFSEIPLVFLMALIIGYWVTIYYGAQRFIAARHSGWWIFAPITLDIVMAVIEPYFLGYITGIITAIYVGVLPDKE